MWVPLKQGIWTVGLILNGDFILKKVFASCFGPTYTLISGQINQISTIINPALVPRTGLRLRWTPHQCLMANAIERARHAGLEGRGISATEF